jgi:hypothetical protein
VHDGYGRSTNRDLSALEVAFGFDTLHLQRYVLPCSANNLALHIGPIGHHQLDGMSQYNAAQRIGVDTVVVVPRHRGWQGKRKNKYQPDLSPA